LLYPGKTSSATPPPTLHQCSASPQRSGQKR